MATTTQHNAARSDPGLLRRFIAKAEQLGVPNAQAFVEQNIGRLISQDIDGNGATPADVHASATVAYDNAVKALPALPGENESAVLDQQIQTAIQKLLAEE